MDLTHLAYDILKEFCFQSKMEPFMPHHLHLLRLLQAPDNYNGKTYHYLIHILQAMILIHIIFLLYFPQLEFLNYNFIKKVYKMFQQNRLAFS